MVAFTDCGKYCSVCDGQMPEQLTLIVLEYTRIVLQLISRALTERRIYNLEAILLSPGKTHQVPNRNYSRLACKVIFLPRSHQMS